MRLLLDPAASMQAFLDMDPFESMNRVLLQAQTATASTQKEPPPKTTPPSSQHLLAMPKTPPRKEHDEERQRWLSPPAQDMTAAIKELDEAEELADKMVHAPWRKSSGSAASNSQGDVAQPQAPLQSFSWLTDLENANLMRSKQGKEIEENTKEEDLQAKQESWWQAKEEDLQAQQEPWWQAAQEPVQQKQPQPDAAPKKLSKRKAEEAETGRKRPRSKSDKTIWHSKFHAYREQGWSIQQINDFLGPCPQGGKN